MGQGGSSEHVKHLENNNHTDSYHKGIRVLMSAAGMDDVLDVGLDGERVKPQGVRDLSHCFKGSLIPRFTCILDLL